MDAITYIREKERMCNHYSDNTKYCPCTSECERYCGCNCNTLSPEHLVSIVEKWSREHPVITNRMKFKEVFGYTQAKVNNCRHYKNHEMTCEHDGHVCTSCPWWDEPYEPKGEATE